MTRSRKIVINISVLIAAALAVSGYAARSGARFVDARYVHADSFAVIQAGEAARAASQEEFQREITIKLDSANLRLTQIQCGRRIVEGCR